MSRLTVAQPDKAQGIVDDIRETLMRRLDATLFPPCRVEFTAAFVGMCASQSCGKCTPCRIGLVQLKNLIDDVLDGAADAQTLKTIERLAEDIYLSADCAIGYEAGAAALRAIRGFRADFEYHMEKGECGGAKFASVPCREGCPARVDIPGYIALVGAGRYQDAVRLIRKDNPLPLVCGLVCEHPCELSCRRGMVDEPINIRALKRYAVDHSDNDYTPFHYEPTGKKVAVIGGGPAGLSAAYFLALMGHEPTIFEQRAHLGGMLRYGIPAYRLPREQLDSEIDFLVNQGIEVKLGVSIPTDVSFEEISEQYDAVFVAIGAHADKKLGIEGENAEGVLSAVQLLRAVGDGNAPDFTGKRVAVVGGGNVAMDCARSAVRLGADQVSIVYRRRVEDMTAQAEEIEDAAAEGCEIMQLYAPVSVKTEGDQVIGLEVQKQIISVAQRGRPAPIKANEPAQVLPVDIVLVAIGQDIDSDPFAEAGIPTNRKRFEGNEFAEAAADSLSGVFVGGDCMTGPATAIKAIAAGKVAARNIDEYLGYDHVIKQEIEVPAALSLDKPACGRSNPELRLVSERVEVFDIAEKGLRPEEAGQEVWRCLRCDRFGYGTFREGRCQQW